MDKKEPSVRIIIADDHTIFRDGLRRLLEAELPACGQRRFRAWRIADPPQPAAARRGFGILAEAKTKGRRRGLARAGVKAEEREFEQSSFAEARRRTGARRNDEVPMRRAARRAARV